jgi:DNA-binding NtrC family response regulator
LETIIIIDNEKELVQIISEYLKLHYVDVVGTGHTGLEAVCLYEKYRPDYVLIDLNMPNYDGNYGISKIKEMDKNAKIIIMTGFMDKIKNEKFASELTVLEKPFRLNKLKQIIMSTKFNRF